MKRQLSPFNVAVDYGNDTKVTWRINALDAAAAEQYALRSSIGALSAKAEKVSAEVMWGATKATIERTELAQREFNSVTD